MSFKIDNFNIVSTITEVDSTRPKLHKSNKPICNGTVENLVNYQFEFQRGFQKFYNLILKEQKISIILRKSPMLNFYNHKIRFINRQTKVYYKILKYLNKPEYLSDSLKFGIKLEVLARGYLNFKNGSPLQYLERIQMLEGDIPVFYISTSDKQFQLLSEESHNLINYSAIENVYRKIKRYSFNDYKYQMTLISDSIKL